MAKKKRESSSTNGQLPAFDSPKRHPFLTSDLIQSTLGPSKKFGELVPEVNSVLLGKKLREYRLALHVSATAVGRLMGRTKVQMHFIETGFKRIDLRLADRYLNAVDEISKKKALAENAAS